MLDWAEAEFNIAIMSRFKNVKENKMAMNEQVENYSWETEMVKKKNNKMVILELKMK